MLLLQQKNGHPIEYIMLLKRLYLRQNMDFSIYESWTNNGRQGHWQGTKPVNGKTANCSSSRKKVYSATAQS